MTNLGEPLRPKNPRSRRSNAARKLFVVPVGQRVEGFLYCRVCTRSWAFRGSSDPEGWPQHRCGKDVRNFNEFLTEDPNHTALPNWKQEAKR